MNESLQIAINALVSASFLLDLIQRKMIEVDGSVCGLPTPKDRIQDAVDAIDGVIEDLKDLEL